MYAIQLQAVCDECLLFTHIFSGFCGGSHNSYVLQNSQLYLDHKEDIRKWFAEPEYHIIGDCVYPLLSYLLKPFPEKADMGAVKTAYNKSLSGCRHTIERVYSLLKNKWKILTKATTNDPEKMNILTCACVLHNFCIMHGGSADVDDFISKTSNHSQKPMSSVVGNDDLVLMSDLAVKWQDIGLDSKENESRLLKQFEKC